MISFNSRLGRHEDKELLVLEAGTTDLNYWSDVFGYRELLAILAWRDIAVQYKQSVFGIAWALLRPLLTMIILSFVFGRVAQLPSEGTAPYALMAMAGVLPWFLFSTILGSASNSLVSNQNLIGKVYFPRILVPAATVGVAMVDFSVGLASFFVMMAVFGFQPHWQITLLPLFFVVAVCAALGPALLFASLNVKYRDFRFVVPFIIQFGLYISPVGFSSTVVPEEWRLLYSVNPMVGAIDGFRWALLGQADIYWPGFVLGLGVNCALLWLGLRTFRNTEKTFADVI